MGKYIQINQQSAKTYGLKSYDRTLSDFSERAKQYEIRARVNGLRGNILGNVITELDTVSAAIKSEINNDFGSKIAQLKIDERTYDELLSTPREETVKYYRDRMSPTKEQELGKIRKATLDQVPVIERQLEEQKWQLAEEQALLDYMKANVYKEQRPPAWLYDNRNLYLIILFFFSAAEWWLTKDAFAHHGGFSNLSSAFWSLFIGSLLAICTHMFGRACFEKDKIAMALSGSIGVVLWLTILLLRTKII